MYLFFFKIESNAQKVILKYAIRLLYQRNCSFHIQLNFKMLKEKERSNLNSPDSASFLV
jgi:hypothetical protein